MIFASYGRKSIYSDHSDSVKNQHRMNRDYANFHFPGKVDSFLTYEDEGMTGANTNRPDLKRLMKDIESGIISALIVYQLDRLSRDVRDFSNIYAFLEEHNVQFISVKENIDTSTPIGKAMMYVSVVFAQMERETTANRVFDNMVGLSDDGWWVGGNPPLPYRRKRIDAPDGKNHVTIVLDESEVRDLRSMYNLFLAKNFSLQGFETYLKTKGIKTRNGKFYSTNQLYKLLTMPYCVSATADIYDFYKEKGCIMSERSPREKWDGSVGVMVYGRTTERRKKHELQPPEKWRVCLGKHEPCIDPSTWLSVQNQFTHNVFNKTMQYPIPLLKGSLRCSCGRLMTLARKKRVDGSVSTWYCCPKRIRQGTEYCDMSSVKSEFLDNKALEIFKNINQDPDSIDQYLLSSFAPNFSQNDRVKIENQILSVQSKIQNLTVALSDSHDTAAIKYIVHAIDDLDSELNQLNRRLVELRRLESDVTDTEVVKERVSRLVNNFDSFSPGERNVIVKSVLQKCVWDGHSLFLSL